MKKLAAILTFLLLTGPAWAETVRFDGQRQDHNLRATGQDVEVRGQYNDVIITGEAGTITIYGQYNDVIVDNAKAIVFKGSYNDVDIRNGNPQILDQGNYNDVVGVYDGQTTGSVEISNGGVGEREVTDDAVIINGAARNEVFQGNGRNFVINGASNSVTINGKANAVTVNGSSNEVHVDQANSINAAGFGNVVTFSSGEPAISRSGVNVTVQRR